jgi:threonine/homoserine/homoserine lactone efflux protein
MTPGVYLTLTATIAVAALTPGPAVTAIVARAVIDGVRPALAINAGVVTGDLLFFALAAAGMTAPARSFGDFFTVIRWLGAAYLVWQGLALWRFQPQAAAIDGRAAHESHFWRNYGAGLLLMFGHVQAMLFYAALLPGFVDLTRLDAADLALVALTLVVVIGAVNSGYALLAARARGFFADQRAQRRLHRVAGTLMLVAAVLVATR